MSGHDCRLPVFGGHPVALDPRTKHRARVGLRIRCVDCGKVYRCKWMPRAKPSEPDLIWKRTFSGPALDYDADEYHTLPEPDAVNWSGSNKPTGPDGLWVWQLDYPERWGTDADQCPETQDSGSGPIGGPVTWATYRCGLKVGHVGSHEAFHPTCLKTGWGA